MNFTKGVEMLLGHPKTDPNVRYYVLGHPLLVAACDDKSVLIMDLLLNDHRTDVNIQDMKGKTALHKAIECSDSDDVCLQMAERLLRHPNIDIHIPDVYGRTAHDIPGSRNRAKRRAVNADEE